jgi:hypothetical protein
VKDSVIAFKTELHTAFCGIFNQSLREQEKLLTENKHLRKQVKRQKLKTKLIAIGTAIIAGIGINYLVQH